MSFGLKNAGTIYQMAMNTIFHDLIGKNMEVYVDDVGVKSKSSEEHLGDLKTSFQRMRCYNLKRTQPSVPLAWPLEISSNI